MPWVFYWIASLYILGSDDHIARAIQINNLQLVPGSNTYIAVYGLPMKDKQRTEIIA